MLYAQYVLNEFAEQTLANKLDKLLQNLGNTGLPFLVTLNPPHAPQNNITIWSTSHPIPTPAAAQASKEFDVIQGKRGIWFCGAYQGRMQLTLSF